MLLIIWLVITLVFLEKPFVSQLGMCDLIKVNWAGALVVSESISVHWTAASESKSYCFCLRLNFEQRFSNLKSSYLMHTISFLIKLIILRFSVKIQLLSVIFTAEML